MIARVRGGSLVVLCTVASCATAQSARTLPPGKTQVTVAGARSTDRTRGDEPIWSADLMVRRGFAEEADAGLRLVLGDARDRGWALLVEPKLQLTEHERRVAVSVSLGGGVGESDSTRTGVFTGGVHVGVELAPTVELVAAARMLMITAEIADDASGASKSGVAIGLRLADRRRRWAVHPELGYLPLGRGLDTLTFAVAISAGN